jgi:hypothetical protein
MSNGETLSDVIRRALEQYATAQGARADKD